MRVVTWNVRRARASSPTWDYLLELCPDVVMLQEVGELSTTVLDAYDVRLGRPVTKAGNPQQFATALAVRGRILDGIELRSKHAWVNVLLDRFSGNVVSGEVELENGARLRAACVYSPAWPIAKDLYIEADAVGIKLMQNPDLWLTDLVTAGLRGTVAESTEEWIVAGDFNSCVTFDAWKGGPRGNAEWLDRMAALGFEECLAKGQGQLTPTFKGPRRSEPNCQIDKMFVNRLLVPRLKHCGVGDINRVIGGGLSDHLPVVGAFAPASM